MKKKDSLVGMYFHTRKDGKIHLQGQIIRELKNDRYVGRIFEWFLGQETCQKVFTFEDVQGFDLYDDVEDFREINRQVIRMDEATTNRQDPNPKERK